MRSASSPAGASTAAWSRRIPGAPLGCTLGDFDDHHLSGTGTAHELLLGIRDHRREHQRRRHHEVDHQEFLAALPPGFDPASGASSPIRATRMFGWQPAPRFRPRRGPRTPTQLAAAAAARRRCRSSTTWSRTFSSPRSTRRRSSTCKAAYAQPQFPRARCPPGFQRPPSFPRLFDIPPLTETRFISDEVMVQITSRIAWRSSRTRCAASD